MSLDWMCEMSGCIPRSLKHSSSRGCSFGSGAGQWLYLILLLAVSPIS